MIIRISTLNCLLLIIIAAGFSFSAKSVCAQNTARQRDLIADIKGKYILAISDGDFLASTYSDGKLPVLDSKVGDQLSIIKLPLDSRRPVTAQLKVSNSVTGAPFLMAVAPDGKTAFVVETDAPPPSGATLRRELPAGRKVTMIDLSDLKSPQISGVLEIAEKPETVDVHPNGKLLVITTQQRDAEIVLLEFDKNGFRKPQSFSLQTLGIESNENLPQAGISASHAQWHPSGNFLAVNLNYRDEIAFFKMRKNLDGTFSLSLWGKPAAVGQDPFTGRFTPNGKYYLTSNWGRNFGEAVKTLEQRLPTTRGSISVIKLADAKAASDNARHRVVSTATTDISPEGIAVSPNGKLVVTTNMRGTLFPQNSPRFTRQASLSLLQIAESGQITKIDDYAFEGVLPENAAFDRNGNYLSVAVFDYLTDQPAGGVEIWRVNKVGKPSLERTNVVIDVGRGAHQVLIK